MPSDATLLFRQSEVEALLSLPDCIEAVEKVFRLQGENKIPRPGILGVAAEGGGLHVKAAFLPGDEAFLVAKLNTNFPDNRTRGWPTIQGLIVLYDAKNGVPLAVLDSVDVTIKRTAAASAVAAKYLARADSRVATICGCGRQGRAHFHALCSVLPLKKIQLHDIEEAVAQNLAQDLSKQSNLEIVAVRDLSKAIRASDVCVTCTTSRRFFVLKNDVSPGTFIAAVGADNEDKQEIDPALMASAKVVTDSFEQCAAIGDLHHAIAQNLIGPEHDHPELSEVVAGRKPGRTDSNEIIIFDSTGVAIEDAVAAVAIFQRGKTSGAGVRFNFAA